MVGGYATIVSSASLINGFGYNAVKLHTLASGVCCFSRDESRLKHLKRANLGVVIK